MMHGHEPCVDSPVYSARKTMTVTVMWDVTAGPVEVVIDRIRPYDGLFFGVDGW